MNFKAIFNLIGTLIFFLGLLMLIPAGISIYFNEGVADVFIICTALTSLLGFLTRILSGGEEKITRKECFVVVTLSWISATIIGSLPFLFVGIFSSFTDAFFETISGLTTTGATVIVDIEAQPLSILFWRSFLQWLGGMGIIVLFIAILPNLGIGGTRLFDAEVPGPVPEKLEPRIRKNAKALWKIYIGLSILMTILLWLAGMNLFDAVNHAFTTMATGGYSTKTASAGAWDSPIIHLILLLFMFMAGTSFALYFRVLHGESKALLRDSEFKFYVFIILIATLIITWNLFTNTSMKFITSLREAGFQVVSIITTTGFATTDFDTWPPLAKGILLTLMFVGGCAGSTGGAIKVGRLLVVLKYSYNELFNFINPRAVTVNKINGIPIKSEVLNKILGFVFIYILTFVLATLIMMALGFDLVSAGSAIASALGNVGPGLGLVGPAKTYAPICALGKWVLSLCMLLGRLELYTVLVLLLPDFWRT